MKYIVVHVPRSELHSNFTPLSTSPHSPIPLYTPNFQTQCLSPHLLTGQIITVTLQSHDSTTPYPLHIHIPASHLLNFSYPMGPPFRKCRKKSNNGNECFRVFADSDIFESVIHETLEK